MSGTNNLFLCERGHALQNLIITGFSLSNDSLNSGPEHGLLNFGVFPIRNVDRFSMSGCVDHEIGSTAGNCKARLWLVRDALHHGVQVRKDAGRGP